MIIVIDPQYAADMLSYGAPRFVPFATTDGVYWVGDLIEQRGVKCEKGPEACGMAAVVEMFGLPDEGHTEAFGDYADAKAMADALNFSHSANTMTATDI